MDETRRGRTRASWAAFTVQIAIANEWLRQQLSIDPCPFVDAGSAADSSGAWASNHVQAEIKDDGRVGQGAHRDVVDAGGCDRGGVGQGEPSGCLGHHAGRPGDLHGLGHLVGRHVVEQHQLGARRHCLAHLVEGVRLPRRSRRGHECGPPREPR